MGAPLLPPAEKDAHFRLLPSDVSGSPAASNLHKVDGLASDAKQGARLRPYQLADDPRALLSEREQVGAISSLHLPRVFHPRVKLQLGLVGWAASGVEGNYL